MGNLPGRTPGRAGVKNIPGPRMNCMSVDSTLNTHVFVYVAAGRGPEESRRNNSSPLKPKDSSP